MYCYVCSELIQNHENYGRGCGAPATWLATFGYFALGILCFGVFAFFFVFFASELRFTPLFRYLVLALAGGISLGFAIHHYSKSRRRMKIRDRNGVLNNETNSRLLPEPTAISFMSISDRLAIPTTSELKVPRGQ